MKRIEVGEYVRNNKKRIEDLKIKRVLTKEQFRQNSYEVGGEKWD